MAPKATEKYFEAVGRRKTAVARVRLFKNTKGAFMVNGLPLEKYFRTANQGLLATQSLALTKSAGHYSVSAKVSGSGIQSQAGAIRHGIARALLLADIAYKPLLRQSKLLTRDARMKERRKFGLKKARKSPQWSKR